MGHDADGLRIVVVEQRARRVCHAGLHQVKSLQQLAVDLVVGDTKVGHSVLQTSKS